MNFVKLEKNNFVLEHYSYRGGSNFEMQILGSFFSDIGHSRKGYSFYKEWAFDDSLGMGFGTNTTFLEKDGNFIFFTDMIPGDPEDEKDETELRMTRKQFFQLIQEWEQKVWKTKPKEVTIKLENNIFTIETKDYSLKDIK